MGKLASNYFLDRSCDEITRLFDSPDRLCDDAGGEFLPLAHHSDHRYVSASEQTQEERQRSILETLITAVAPTEARPIADALLSEFITLGRIFVESRESLERVIGSNRAVAQLLHAAHSALVEGLRSDIPMRLLSATDQKLIDYLVVGMGSHSQELLRVLFLNRSNNVVGDEILCVGSLHSMTVYSRCIFKRAFELSASSIIIVHNHPGGSVEPSESDIGFTKSLVLLGKPLEVEIKDHIIVTQNNWFSFLRQGLL
jgi:DNA repair protein RadC